MNINITREPVKNFLKLKQFLLKYSRLIVISLTITAIDSQTVAQSLAPPIQEDTLAKVGTAVVTARDLYERIELMPWPEKEKPKHYDTSKVKALQSIVAERLLAMEGALSPSVSSDEGLQLKIDAMEKTFIRDELYKRAVTQKIKNSEAEIRDGLAKFEWELHVIAAGVKNRAAGDSLCRLLKRISNPTMALKKFPASLMTALDTVKVNFGGLDTVFEKAVYSNGMKRFTRPFKSNAYGWVVAVLIERTTNPVCSRMNAGERRYHVDEVLRRRKSSVAGSKYYDEVLFAKKAQADSALFTFFTRGVRNYLLSDSLAHKRNGLYMVAGEDIDPLSKIFSSDLHKPLIAMNAKPLTIGEVLEYFRIGRFGFPTLQEQAFAYRLNQTLKTIVQMEWMTREGYRMQLESSLNVRHDLSIWSNYWKSRYLMWLLNDTVQVPASDVASALIDSVPVFGTIYQVNVQEVLCDTLPVAAQVLDSLKSGTRLETLAKNFSRRKEWAVKGGISGYFPIKKHPELGVQALLLDSGSIHGPIKLPEGYSIFKVLGKRTAAGHEYPAADSMVTILRTTVTGRNRQLSMNRYVASLAKKYGVEFYYEKLPLVKIMPANMFTRRAIGFGGVITASPFLYPNYGWVKDWQESQKILP